MRIYVGTKNQNEKQFRTLKEAKEFIEENDINEEIEVIFEEGRYTFSETVRFNENDKPCVYRAEEGKKVYFDGGITLDNNLVKKVSDSEVLERIIEENARENIYEIDLSGYDIDLGEYGARGFRHPYIPSPNELFIDSVPQTIARYPKNDYIPLGNVIDAGSEPIHGIFRCAAAFSDMTVSEEINGREQPMHMFRDFSRTVMPTIR